MGSNHVIRASCALAVVTGLIAGSVATAASGQAPEPPATRAAPELRPGEIVIKKTGRKRVTRGAAPARDRRKADPIVELPYEGPGPRTVTIGYFRRDPLETGWGPRVYVADYYGGGYCGSSSFGGYGYGHGYAAYRSSSYCDTPLLFGSRPYSIPVPSVVPCGRVVR